MRTWRIAVALAVTLTACGGGGDERLTVLAASSLTEVLTALEAEFEAANPGVDVVISFAGSSSLAAQIEAGAAADVFVAADLQTMDRVVRSGRAIAEPSVVARNTLTIAVEPGNPKGIRGLADLADDELVVVLAAPEVPAGAYAEELLRSAGAAVEAASLEQSVRAVVSKVALGEADAGIVYRTDVVAAAGRVDEVPVDSDVMATYYIAPVSASPRAAGWIDLVTGPAGRDALLAAGFEVP